jgi:hypothetical protein
VFTNLSVRCIWLVGVHPGDIATAHLGGGTPDELGVVTGNPLSSILTETAQVLCWPADNLKVSNILIEMSFIIDENVSYSLTTTRSYDILTGLLTSSYHPVTFLARSLSGVLTLLHESAMFWPT